MGGARPVQAMLGGSIDVSQAGGASIVSAAAQGAEVVILGTVFTRLIFGVHAAPQIKDVGDIKGKSIAAGSVGGNSYFASQLFLSKVGLVPNKDVLVRALNGTPEVLAALQHGQVQAGVLAAPTTSIATRMGFRQIFDIAKLTLPVVAKYMRVPKDDPALRESYQTYGRQLDQNLRPSLEGIKFILDFLAEQRPGVKTKNPADFVDFRFVSKLEEEGFFKRLATK